MITVKNFCHHCIEFSIREYVRETKQHGGLRQWVYIAASYVYISRRKVKQFQSMTTISYLSSCTQKWVSLGRNRIGFHQPNMAHGAADRLYENYAADLPPLSSVPVVRETMVAVEEFRGSDCHDAITGSIDSLSYVFWKCGNGSSPPRSTKPTMSRPSSAVITNRSQRNSARLPFRRLYNKRETKRTV